MRFDFSGLSEPKLSPCTSAINAPFQVALAKEATMAYVASIVDIYRTPFGKLPGNVADLDKLPTFENADKLNGNEMKRICFIQQMHSSRTYALTCGGKWPSVENSVLRHVRRLKT